MIILKRVKWMDGRGNRSERTERQIKASSINGTRVMIRENPMWNLKYRIRQIIAKTSIQSKFKPFRKGNIWGALRTQESKRKSGQNMGKMNKGKKPSQKARDKTRLRDLLNNPMKNPEIVKKKLEKQRLAIMERCSNISLT